MAGIDESSSPNPDGFRHFDPHFEVSFEEFFDSISRDLELDIQLESASKLNRVCTGGGGGVYSSNESPVSGALTSALNSINHPPTPLVSSDGTNKPSTDGRDQEEESYAQMLGDKVYLMVVSNEEMVVFDEDIMENDIGDLIVEASESELESESEDNEDVKLTEASKNSIYNRDGLLDKLGDISWPDNIGWIHKLSIDIDQDQEVDVNDDLARELAFYTQALEGTRETFKRLETVGLPFLRPFDYYAEMVKVDAHMEKVKGRLLAEKRKIEEAEERRKARDAKRLAKEVQAQKQKERVKQKKEEIESVKKWRKQRQQSGFAGGDKESEMSFAFEEGKAFERSNKKRPGVAPGDRSGGKARQGGGRGKTGKDKRKDKDFKNSKFGFGGRKGLKKQNTADTTNDFRGFTKGYSSGNKKRKR